MNNEKSGPGATMKRLAELSPVKRALLELRETRAKLEALEQARSEPIAVIGMGCRLPGGANDPQQFWRLLQGGVDAITEIPADRWDVEAYYNPDPQAPGQMSTRWGGFLEQVDRFDPQFFGISPREADSVDPQQRLLLEVTWEALEHAGQAPDRLTGSRTGVFVGISSSDYLQLLINRDPRAIDAYLASGFAHSAASGRVAYVLGLQGPAVSLDTACSSSLVAVHLAVQSLRLQECRMAVAGGVNVILLPELLVGFSKSEMMAADGRCKTFDARADGFVRAEGCGMVVLKPLSAALADNDHIWAVIRGSAANQDGRSNGLTAPNRLAQEAVIREALANAGIEAEQIGYVETHGTGTSLGDPIEIQALAATVCQGRSADNPLLVGSVKTNLGHLEAAAGVVGLMKAVLALAHKELPPHLHLQNLNPYIPWNEIPISIPRERTPFPGRDGRWIAGVSSFGFSGTNVHVILEAAAAQKLAPLDRERPVHILPLSAKRETGLTELIDRLQTHLAEDQAGLADVCFTAATGRAHLPHRLVIVAESTAQARDKLAAFRQGQEPVGLFRGHVYGSDRREVAFLFTGHGDQYPGMGWELYQTQPTYRAALDECNELLRSHLERTILSVLHPEAGAPDLLNTMTYAQPALFALEYALATLWRSWGVKPDAVMGHSVGEYAAACAAGVFSLADALKLVAARGYLMDSIPQDGEMVAVFADEERVLEALARHVEHASIAAINGPKNVVISGRRPVLEAIIADLRAEGIRSRRLAVAQAAHSPLLDPILDEFEKIAREVAYSAPEIPLISCTTGLPVSAAQVTSASYWRRHLRQPVRFATAMESLYHEGVDLFVEVGPHPTLLAMGRRCLPDDVGTWLPSLRQGMADWQQMLESLAALYVNGVEIDWAGFDRDYAQGRRRVTLPTYPWARERYWVEASQTRPAARPPETLSLWQTIATGGLQQAQQCPLDLALGTYQKKWQVLDRLTTGYILRTLRELGCFAQPGESHSIDSLVAECNILPAYRSLLARWLNRLAEQGYLQQQAEAFVCRQSLPEVSVDSTWVEARDVADDMPLLLDYVERCGEKLTAVLTGKESALETLFPAGSYATARYLYHDWSMVRYFNAIMGAMVQSMVKVLPHQSRLRILEVGAGTGGTTEALLPALPPGQTLYHFTDVSELFLGRAEESFQAFPFMRFGLLDLEQEPTGQGYQPHSFDMVIAANALHATANLRDTLDHVLSPLAPGGLLLLFEVTTHLSWFDITTGLIEGWGRFEDEWRTDSPLLSVTQWTELLRARGFERVLAFPEAGSPAEILGAHVLVVQAPLVGDSPAAFEHADHAQPELPAEAPRQQDTETSDGAPHLRSQLEAALPDERKELLVTYVREHVARVLRLAPSHPLHPRDRLRDLGVDSLMAMELKNRVETGLALKRRLPATLVFDYPTIEAVAGYLEKELFDLDRPQGLAAEDAAQTGSTAKVEQAMIAATEVISQLSEAEVEALLLKKLEGM